ncbi:MAG: hypothetical protein ACD_7C00251G0001 [uncultured bacterium]|nr:MAG: hypothetical protein ACD_7C00251G0001 [uncultured bacterium]
MNLEQNKIESRENLLAGVEQRYQDNAKEF